MEKGIGMMLKAMGIDPEKIVNDFESLKTTVTGTLEAIDKKISNIENQLSTIKGALEDQKDTWKQIQTHLNTPQPAPTAPLLLSSPPKSQPEKPQPQQ